MRINIDKTCYTDFSHSNASRMFRCIFVLLLLNSSYRSFGVPLPTSSTASLDKLLAALASSCENVFLSNQIKSQLNHCSAPLLPHGGKQLECLLFYDINTQLCAAVGDSKLALSEDYSTKINEEQDVNLVCANTKDWVFSNITEFPLYLNTIKKVFKHPVPCGKMCGLEDLMSDDMKFICKYFKWGTEILKQQVTTPPNNPLQVQEIANTEDKPVNPASNDMQDVQVKNAPTSKSLGLPSELAHVKTDETEKTEAVKPEASSDNNQEPSSVDADADNAAPKAVIEEPIAVNPPAAEQSDSPLATDSKVKSETENKAISPDTSLNKPSVDNSEKAHIETDVQKLNKEIEHKEDQNRNPAQPKAKEPNDDDYQDSEDKDGLGDIQGEDDSDDPNVDDVNKLPKVEVKQELSETQSVKTVSSDITTGERISGIYPSFGDETYADDDDDHFFSFFLTAVIMVVVIYILYHNKNKVVKVFFGLILEGRQSGRRRNSRGHAYRRLDTLEQAMSTNSAAPPSKIIY